MRFTIFSLVRALTLAALLLTLWVAMSGASRAQQPREFAAPVFVAYAPQSVQVMPAPRFAGAGCVNCTTCKDCSCFGGGYYCKDGGCPVGFGAGAQTAGTRTVCENGVCRIVKDTGPASFASSGYASGACANGSCGASASGYSAAAACSSCGTGQSRGGLFSRRGRR